MSFSIGNPFSPVINLLKGWFDWIRWFFTDVWKQSLQWIVTFWGAVVTFAGWVWFVVRWYNEILQAALDKISALGMPAFTPHGSVGQMFAVANTILPLDEAIQWMIAWLGLVGAILVFKIGKRIFI